MFLAPSLSLSLSSIASTTSLSLCLRTHASTAASTFLLRPQWSGLISPHSRPSAAPHRPARWAGRQRTDVRSIDDMGNKKGLAAIFSRPSSTADVPPPSPPWPWPSCAHGGPHTASFRGPADDDDDGRRPRAGGRLPPREAAGDMYRTVNAVYFDPADSRFSFVDDDDDDEEDGCGVEALDDDCASFSTTAAASEEWSEAVIRSLRRSPTDRFFFDVDPGLPPASNSILAASRSPSLPGRTLLVARSLLEPRTHPAAAVTITTPDDDHEGDSEADEEQDPPSPPPPSSSTRSTSPLVEESVAVALDSEDPYRDFRASMEEMVAAHGLRDWAALQELLSWYLRINASHNHALIVGAFVDLLVGIAAASGSRSSATTTTTTTTMTTTTTSTATAATTTSSSSSSDELLPLHVKSLCI